MKQLKWSIPFLILFLFIFSCNDNPDDSSINIFSVENDIALGKELDDTLQDQLPILPRSQYPQAYAHLDRITSEILNSGNVHYADRFPWTFRIVEDDSTLNAFATPGGFIYVYTGLIKFLDSEEQLAGVLAHEIAHADRRHSTDQLTKIYGISLLLQVVLGQNQGLLSDIAASLLTLSFSREAESEADRFSVIYLCPTMYEADGAADFFEKIESAGGSGPPEFLSTHPSPANRIEAIRQEAQSRNCAGSGTFVQRYQDFKNSLP